MKLISSKLPCSGSAARVLRRWILAVLCVGSLTAQTAPQQGDFSLSNFRFTNGQQLPKLDLHYTTLGRPTRDSRGHVSNAVLILHGTGGTGAQFLSPQFRDVLFQPGQLLDASKYFLILPDDIGHGSHRNPAMECTGVSPNMVTAT